MFVNVEQYSSGGEGQGKSTQAYNDSGRLGVCIWGYVYDVYGVMYMINGIMQETLCKEQS